LLMVLEDGESKIKVSAILVSGKGFINDTCCCILTQWKRSGSLLQPLYEGTNLIQEGEGSWLNHFPKAPLLRTIPLSIRL
jgi:hypothetical protein